jgi:DNA-directed RNA polymerase specialized sigma24 family protein
MNKKSEMADAMQYLLPLVGVVSRTLERKYRCQFGELYSVCLEGAWLAAEKYDGNKHPSLWQYARVTINFVVVDEDRRGRGRAVGSSARKGLAFLDPHSFSETFDSSHQDCNFSIVEARVTVEQILAQCSEETVKLLTRIDLQGELAVSIAREQGVTEGRISQLRKAALKEARSVTERTREPVEM